MSCRLSGRAGRYLRVLQDLGHLDEDLLNALLINSSQEADSNGVVQIDGVRRAAARMIFRRQEGMVGGPMAADWPMLFS